MRSGSAVTLSKKRSASGGGSVLCCSEGNDCTGTDVAQGKDWKMTYPSCKAIWPYSQRQLGRCV